MTDLDKAQAMLKMADAFKALLAVADENGTGKGAMVGFALALYEDCDDRQKRLLLYFANGVKVANSPEWKDGVSV